MVAVTHPFVSAKADGLDPALVQPSNWNANHLIVTTATDVVVGRQTAGGGPAEEIPCSAFGRSVLALADLTALAALAGTAETGDVKWRLGTGVRTGWVRANGRTIGNAASGATELADPTASGLFSFLWTNFSNTICPVSGGRGGSAATDFAAARTIGLPDARGRTLAGLDDMGNTAAGRLTAMTTGSVTTPGSSAGEEKHTLLAVEMAAHTHAFTGAAVADHSHVIYSSTDAAAQAKGTSYFLTAGSGTYEVLAPSTGATSTTAQKDGSTRPAGGHTPAGTNASTGSDTPHNNMQPTLLASLYIRL